MSHLVIMEKDGVRIRVAKEQVDEHLATGWVTPVGFRIVSPQTEDVRFPASGINPPGAATDPTRDPEDGRLVFSASQVNIIAVQAQLPHSWVEGTDIDPHVHWSPTDSNAGNVLWRMEYKIADAITEAFPADWTTLNVLAAAAGTFDQHQLKSFGKITMEDKHVSCMMLIRISRIGNDPTDTYASTVKLNEFDIHALLDSLGSDEEYYK
jgi:hypothetical protein